MIYARVMLKLGSYTVLAPKTCFASLIIQSSNSTGSSWGTYGMSETEDAMRDGAGKKKREFGETRHFEIWAESMKD
jgi:hypothetical protein